MSDQNNNIIWISWRQLAAKKGRTLSIMSLISIFGVAVGVAALVIVLSIMGGFQRDLKEKIFLGLPHMEIFAQNTAAGFSLKEIPLSTFQAIFGKELSQIEPFIKSDVVIKHEKYIASVTLFGVNKENGGKLWKFSDSLIEGKLSDVELPIDSYELSKTQQKEKLPGLILGESLAIYIGAQMGDVVSIISPQIGFGQVLNGETSAALFQIRGIFQTNLPQYDGKYAITSLEASRKFLPEYDPSLDEDEYVSGIAMSFKNPNLIENYKSQIRNDLELKLSTWKDVNKSLLFALQLEKFTMGSILFLIVIIAAFSISGTLMMTVFHRQNQIAILRSLGMTEKMICKLYLIHGGFIGLVGTIIGLLLGLGICFLLYKNFLVNILPEDLVIQNKLPVKFLPFEYFVIAISAWGLSFFAAIYPALTAARQAASKGLRHI